jgi:hypothetical protein
MGEEVYQLSIEPDAIAEYLITGWVKQTRSNVIRYFRNRITLQTRETRPQQIVAAVDPAVAQHKPGPRWLDGSVGEYKYRTAQREKHMACNQI